VTRHDERCSMGVAGLDDILSGGLVADRVYLLQGQPGTGKTTLALQFLFTGRDRGEPVLYITLSETRDEIYEVARSHGFSMEGVSLYELSTAEESLRLQEGGTMYATSDIELQETMRVLLDEVERVKPRRVVFDSLSEVRLLSQTPVRFRRQLLALKQHFGKRRSTVLLLDDLTAERDEPQLASIAHGVLSLEQIPSSYGVDRRRLRVAKLRGSSFRSGYHDFVIRRGGLDVFPRLVAAEHRTDYGAEALPSGVPGLDAMLDGGIDRGTAALILGPAGAGKSILAMQLACAAANRGEHVSMFLFEERLGTVRARARGLGMPLFEHADAGQISIMQIDPAEVAPDEFSHQVRRAIENEATRVVIIDSINGYLNAMPEERALTLQMHELLSYAGARGVATVLTLAQSGVMNQMHSPVDVSYLADTVLLLRYFEAEGRVRKALSVLKKRSGRHEDTIREMRFDATGIHLSAPLVAFRGVLTGVPVLRSPAEHAHGPRIDG
jgi:circadian clock protein KaiC